MTAPDIHSSTREEREQYIIDAFRCIADCDNCGACQFLHGHPAEELYADYIEGRRSFRDITLELRYK
ncbi:MAG: hypothetical protein PUF37_02890 [Prevotellaceae bacterium]|nr:hypothetical protein [Prevotellaceae bacterium]